jgi:hypothetical protein
MTTSADATPPPAKARITGVVYLFYLLTSVSDQVLVGRGRLLAFEAVDLIAYAFYITVTLLLITCSGR